MTKYILVGLLAFALFCAALAPACLLSVPLARLGGPSLTEAAGTLWRGSGDLRWGAVELGTLEWHFDLTGIGEGAAAFHLRLYDENTHLHGRLAAGFGRTALAAEGGLDAAAFNPWLAAYGLQLSGWLQLHRFATTFADGRLESADAEVEWSGGPVRYPSGGKSLSARLPPMLARVQSTAADSAEAAPGIQARVATLEGELPLIEAQAVGSWLKIGVTKRLLRLVNAPWPGQEGDDEVVITLEEQLL